MQQTANNNNNNEFYHLALTAKWYGAVGYKFGDLDIVILFLILSLFVSIHNNDRRHH